MNQVGDGFYVAGIESITHDATVSPASCTPDSTPASTGPLAKASTIADFGA